MRYDFLKTETINGIEVAYLLDNETGKVIKSLVEDFTNGVTIKRESVFDRREKKLVPRFEEEVESDMVDPPIRLQKKPELNAPSIIPAHLRGVFLPADTPGAAVETRRT